MLYQISDFTMPIEKYLQRIELCRNKDYYKNISHIRFRQTWVLTSQTKHQTSPWWLLIPQPIILIYLVTVITFKWIKVVKILFLSNLFSSKMKNWIKDTIISVIGEIIPRLNKRGCSNNYREIILTFPFLIVLM